MTTSAVSTATAAAPTQAPTRTERRRPNARKVWSQVALYAALTIGALIILLPLFWILLTSFKTDSDAIDSPASPIPNPFSLEAYQLLSNGSQPILQWFLNSLAAGALQT